MKVARMETFLVPPRWLFLRVETDTGVVGWGEPVVEGRAETVQAAVHELSELIVGADPLRIEDHWQVLAKAGFYRDGPILTSALAGIDQALWDIAGQVRGAPVHELLGGPVRDRVRVYSWIGGDDPAQVAEQAAAQMEAGFTAVKMNASGAMAHVDTPAQLARVVRRMAEVRAAVGDERDVALDFHGRVSIPMAKRLLRELEPLQPLFVEEPVLPEHGHALAELVRATTIPLACGERLYTRWDFRPVLEAGVAVIQPDVSHAGGISEMRRIGALAEIYGVGMAPHCPLGPISLAASLQVAFATPNVVIQEQSIGIHYNRGNDVLDYLVDPSVFTFVDGHVERPLAPGLGIAIDDAAVREAAARGHRWRPPVWRHRDGTLAEW